MTDAVTIYHNPRCSKSRETLSLLQSRGIDPQVVLYLDTPPDADTLRELLQLLHHQLPEHHQSLVQQPFGYQYSFAVEDDWPYSYL